MVWLGWLGCTVTFEAEVRTVDPAVVDPAVVAHHGLHWVGRPDSAIARDELLLFFPGTGARPVDYARFLGHAVDRGLYVVGLSYDNRDAINFDVCRTRPAEEPCHQDARLEVLRGVPSPYDPPDVDVANAAYPRLAQLLDWLATDRPDEAWSTFIDDTEPDGVRFADVIVAGHSQGGGHAAFTARLHEVSRAILFDATEAAEWTTEPLVTPSDRLFGIVHVEEFGAAAMQRSWDQMGMPAANTELGAPLPSTFEGPRFLIVRTDCQGDGNARLHNCAVADGFLPPDDGVAVFTPLWTRLLD